MMPESSPGPSSPSEPAVGGPTPNTEDHGSRARLARLPLSSSGAVCFLRGAPGSRWAATLNPNRHRPIAVLSNGHPRFEPARFRAGEWRPLGGSAELLRSMKPLPPGLSRGPRSASERHLSPGTIHALCHMQARVFSGRSGPMRVKHLPPSEPSPSPSAPPRSGSTRRPVLAGVQLLVTLLLAAAPLEAQWVGVGFAASTFGTSFQTQSSLWFEVTPGFYGSWVSSGPTGGLVNYRHGVRGAQRGWRGHRGSDRHYGYGYWGNSCWDLLWDPWSSYWPGCPPSWAAGLWWPYQATAWGWQGYPSYPVHHAAYRPLGHHGWSIGVHLSFGNHWGADPYAWRPFDPWSYGWDRYAWYSPRPAWRTIYVDTRPRWVVSPTPRVVRAGLSPRTGRATASRRESVATGTLQLPRHGPAGLQRAAGSPSRREHAGPS